MYLDGSWREARAIAERGVAFGAYVLERAMGQAVAPIAHAMGDADAALAIIATYLPNGPATVPGSAVLLDALAMQRLAATIALDAGDPDRARAWLEANDRWLDWSGSVLGQADHRLAWARFHYARRDLARARDLVDTAIVAAADPAQPLVLMGANRLAGAIRRETGDASGAREALTTALALAEASAAPYERALTLIELARLPGDRADALLAEARVILEQLGAAPALARLDAAARPSREHAPDPFGLTPREVEVLELVARGLTDAEASDRLSISPRTVGQHLRSIYGKLEVRSRTEATRLAIERRLV
jgi:DNA-binding CsgD family transcriptional regulator